MRRRSSASSTRCCRPSASIPQRVYLRRWLPELARLPDAWIHRPWQAPGRAARRGRGQARQHLPAPVVDFPASRAAALAAYATIRGASAPVRALNPHPATGRNDGHAAIDLLLPPCSPWSLLAACSLWPGLAASMTLPEPVQRADYHLQRVGAGELTLAGPTGLPGQPVDPGRPLRGLRPGRTRGSQPLVPARFLARRAAAHHLDRLAPARHRCRPSQRERWLATLRSFWSDVGPGHNVTTVVDPRACHPLLRPARPDGPGRRSRVRSRLPVDLARPAQRRRRPARAVAGRRADRRPPLSGSARWTSPTAAASGSSCASGSTAADSTRTSPRPGADETGVDWGRIVPFALMHLACLLVLVRRREHDGRRRLRRALPGAHVRDHRVLPPLLLAPLVQDLARGAVRVRGARRVGGAARARSGGPRTIATTTPASDKPQDTHSPVQHGFLWAHMGWFLSRRHFHPDLRKRPRPAAVSGTALARPLRHPGAVPARAGPAARRAWRSSGTRRGWAPRAASCWSGASSSRRCCVTTAPTRSTRSATAGARAATPRGTTAATTRWLALITLGEGWHNNHHHYPSAARQGFYWWEIDITYYLLRGLAALGVIWDLNPGARPHPRRARGGCRMRIAIVGSGIAGLYAAWRLAAEHDVTRVRGGRLRRRPHAHGRRRVRRPRLGDRHRLHRLQRLDLPELHRAAAASSASPGSRRT